MLVVVEVHDEVESDPSKVVNDLVEVKVLDACLSGVQKTRNIKCR